MATTVKITETYDLKTTVGKLGIIGIHTPTPSQFNRLYPGLVKNHRFIRLKKCDITGVCASVLPADPLQVGVGSGDVAPEDLFNPILYRPVSNESFETVVNRMYFGSDLEFNGNGSINYQESTQDPFEVYYSLLSESKRWKKAMPQNGFALRGLYPICYQMINTFGNQQYPIDRSGAVDMDEGDATMQVPYTETVRNSPSNVSDTTIYGNLASVFRGKAVKMPRLPLHTSTEGHGTTLGDVQLGNFSIPKTFVGMFIIPPARLHEFYYRMRISWTVSFEGVISTVEVGNFAELRGIASSTYDKNFTYESSKANIGNEGDLADTSNVTMTKIMES